MIVRLICVMIGSFSVQNLTMGQVRLDKPDAEAIANGTSLAISGSTKPAQPVTVTVWNMQGIKVGNKNVTPPAGGVWAATLTIPADTDTVLVVATQAGPPASADFRLACCVSDAPQPNPPVGQPQRVQLIWTQGADNALKELADTTVKNLIANDLNVFVDRVHDETREVLENLYSPYNIQWVTAAVAAANPNTTTTITFDDIPAMTDFGRTPRGVDYQNRRLNDECFVFPRTILKCIQPNPVLESDNGWEKVVHDTDSLPIRIDDVGQCLGRTAAHELGHALGLVANSDGGEWMRGADNHTDPRFDLGVEKVLMQALPVGMSLSADAIRRWDRGRHIMDATGDFTGFSTFLVLAHHRIGEPDAQVRQSETLPRVPAAFNRMNQSYLSRLLPR